MSEPLHKFRSGDKVFHWPSGETWILAVAENHRVAPCGWPETIANADDCSLIEAASDNDAASMILKWAAMDSSDIRVIVAKRLVAENAEKENLNP